MWTVRSAVPALKSANSSATGDPTAAATADITAFTPTRTVARYSGTVAELFADFTTGTPDRTVHAHPLTVLATPTDGRR